MDSSGSIEVEQSGPRLGLVVGLGNPGEEYDWTPHNLGFMAADELARRDGARVDTLSCQALTRRVRIAGEPVWVAKPVTFMNRSGGAVRELLDRLQLAPRQMLVICDDRDLPLGTLRMRERGSAGTHNGMRSIVDAIGNDFARLRLGIEPGHPVSDLAAYVLTPWRRGQRPEVERLVGRAADAVEMIEKDGWARAMNAANAPSVASDGGNGKG